MNIKRQGRTYDDTPTPQVLDGEGQRDNYRINRVGIVANFTGRVFDNSRALMDYFASFDGIIVSITIDGEDVPGGYVCALYLYLRSTDALKYFRRDRVTWHSRADLVSLLTQVGFPSQYVTRLQPTNQVPAGLKDSRRAASHCGAS